MGRGRVRNTSSESNVSQLTVTGNIAEDILPGNEDRTFLSITAINEDGWVREFSETIDSALRTGIFLQKGIPYTFPVDNIHTGIYSVINDKFNKFPTFHFTERS